MARTLLFCLFIHCIQITTGTTTCVDEIHPEDEDEDIETKSRNKSSLHVCLFLSVYSLTSNDAVSRSNLLSEMAKVALVRAKSSYSTQYCYIASINYFLFACLSHIRSTNQTQLWYQVSLEHRSYITNTGNVRTTTA